MLNVELHDQIDCESLADFWQYYRGQYFGVKAPNDKIYSCYIHDRDGTDIILGQFNGDEIEKVRLSWDEFKRVGLFGNPVLGTIEFGPTYAYLSANARRESIKGLSLGKLLVMCPNKEFVFGEYGKSKNFFKNAFTGGQFASPDELRTAYTIYNKKYFEWYAALSLLERGKRLGFPVSRHCGMFLDPGSSGIQLSYKARKVGTVTSDGPYASEVLLARQFTPLIPVLSHILPTTVTIR
jgi:hypothetical protein